MNDVDVIDRKYTTLSSVQTVLTLLIMLPLIAVALHFKPAIPLWFHGKFQEAIWTAILIPGVYAFLLGFAFPIISTVRGEMNRRALWVTLSIFSTLTIPFILMFCFSSIPYTQQHPPAHPTSTAWLNAMNELSLNSTFAGYAAGFAIGCLISLFVLNPRLRGAAESR